MYSFVTIWGKTKKDNQQSQFLTLIEDLPLWTLKGKFSNPKHLHFLKLKRSKHNHWRTLLMTNGCHLNLTITSTTSMTYWSRTYHLGYHRCLWVMTKRLMRKKRSPPRKISNRNKNQTKKILQVLTTMTKLSRFYLKANKKNKKSLKAMRTLKKKMSR